MYVLPNQFMHLEAKNGGAIIRAGAIIGTNTILVTRKLNIVVSHIQTSFVFITFLS